MAEFERISGDSKFNPALPGTPESLWKPALARSALWIPRSGPLVVVSPHPDDEVLGAGGLMRTWLQSGHDVTVLSITDGEKSHPDWPKLAERRRAELDRALEILCPTASISTVRLGLPDGGGPANAPRIREALAELCASRPTLIAPYESDGHPDHEAAGEACLEIAQEFQLPIARYAIWAWHHRHPRDMARARLARFALDSATRGAKARAINCYGSQLAPHGSHAPIIPAQVLPYFQRDFEVFFL